MYKNLDSEIKLLHYSPKTLEAYRGWVRQLQGFTRSKDPQLLSSTDVKDFLTYLAVKRKVSASSQNQAFNALLFFIGISLKMNSANLKMSSGPKENLISLWFYHGKRLTGLLNILDILTI